MNISCNDIQPLLPGYLDGELSEAQARPARAHLLECCACRELVQEGKALSRWFKQGQAVAPVVPQGFSARVARRAFAGDPGMELPAHQGAAGASERSTLMPFLLKLSALAAAVLFVLALQIKQQSLPSTKDAEAGNYSPPWVDQPSEPSASRALGLPAGAPLDPVPLPGEPKDEGDDERDRDER